jgi:hypothetical protein
MNVYQTEWSLDTKDIRSGTKGLKINEKVRVFAELFRGH